jgi:hypothetical protein
MVVIAIVAVCSLAFLMNFSVDESEKMDCLTWQNEVSLAAFYLTPSQSAQCHHYNILINAPVHE